MIQEDGEELTNTLMDLNVQFLTVDSIVKTSLSVQMYRDNIIQVLK